MACTAALAGSRRDRVLALMIEGQEELALAAVCLFYTSDAADERSSVDIGGGAVTHKKKNKRSMSLSHCNKLIY